MLINYATGHRWVKPVQTDPLADFGKNTLARLKSTLNRIGEYDITNEVAPLSEEFLTWFLPLYETRINEKDNPRVFDIRSKTLGSKNPSRYYCMTLRENGTNIGGTVFSLKNGKMSIAYRTYAHNWVTAELPANPSAYTEYLINSYAQENGAHTIIHGKDRNPYGLNSSIGLAAFKLGGGCTPELPRVFHQATLDTTTIDRDVFIFKFPETGTQITQAYLIADEAGKAKWQSVMSYKDRLKVEWLPRTNNASH